ncbi:hypothetical protein FB451DRAFT_1174175 [Mycena latifolia]|nr:hypothetical protein FB451DRAFT_1174175 [Mycena latifolia]
MNETPGCTAEAGVSSTNTSEEITQNYCQLVSKSDAVNANSTFGCPFNAVWNATEVNTLLFAISVALFNGTAACANYAPGFGKSNSATGPMMPGLRRVGIPSLRRDQLELPQGAWRAIAFFGHPAQNRAFPHELHQTMPMQVLCSSTTYISATPSDLDLELNSPAQIELAAWRIKEPSRLCRRGIRGRAEGGREQYLEASAFRVRTWKRIKLEAAQVKLMYHYLKLPN